jgi:hypothetical protein
MEYNRFDDDVLIRFGFATREELEERKRRREVKKLRNVSRHERQMDVRAIEGEVRADRRVT